MVILVNKMYQIFAMWIRKSYVLSLLLLSYKRIELQSVSRWIADPIVAGTTCGHTMPHKPDAWPRLGGAGLGQ